MESGYRPTLGPFSATMLIAGTMIGSGIFIVPAEMIRTGGSGAFLLLAWGLTAALTLLGAHSYGELAGMFPRAGGPFTYLKEAFGPCPAFLYGWSTFLIIECGAIAAVSMAFGKYAGVFLPWVDDGHFLAGPWTAPAFSVGGITLGPYAVGLTPVRLLAIAVILLLTWINTLGGRFGAAVQNAFTLAKLAALGALVVLGLAAPALPGAAPVPPSGEGLPFLAALLVVQTGSLFSSDAWSTVTFIAPELREPRRTIPLALLVGPLLVLGLYLLANVAYLRVLGPAGIAAAPDDRVGSAALRAILGPGGDRFMAGAILVSTFGCANGLILAGSRLYQGMAAEGLFFPAAARLNAQGAPGASLAMQGLWACLLCLSGGFAQLLEFTIFAALLFYAATTLALFALRARRPDLPRPVRVLAWPLPPLLYLMGIVAIMVALLLYRPSYTWPGLALVLLGLPVYHVLFRGRLSR